MVRKYWHIGVMICILLTLTLTPCRSFSLSESRGAGGTPNETKFAQQFTSMMILNETTGSPGEPDQEGGT